VVAPALRDRLLSVMNSIRSVVPLDIGISTWRPSVETFPL